MMGKYIPYEWKIRHPYLGKFLFLYLAVRKYRNWITALHSLFRKDDRKSLLVFRDGLKAVVRHNASDGAMLNETALLEVYRWLAGKIDKDSIVVDAGAHIGSFTIACCRNAKKVVVIEAEPSNAKITSENIRLNRMSNCAVLNAALAGKPGKLRFSTDGSSAAYNMFKGGNKGVSVSAVTLPGIMGKYGLDRIDCLKMNIEGAEEGVIMNSPLDKIHYIMMEIHPQFVDVNRILKRLKASDFMIHKERSYIIAENKSFRK
jgi:FkbM family methyltransferase